MTGLSVALDLIASGVLVVDTKGRVWKQKEVRNTGALVNVPRRRAEQPNKVNGYLYVMVRQRGRVFNVQAHRLVWTVLRGQIPPEKDLNHLDGNKTRNDPSNLEVVTRGENHRHAYRTGLKSTTNFPRDYSDRAKALRAQGLSFSKIAQALGISQTTAFRAVSS